MRTIVVDVEFEEIVDAVIEYMAKRGYHPVPLSVDIQVTATAGLASRVVALCRVEATPDGRKPKVDEGIIP